MIDSVSHFRQKKLSSRQPLFQIPGNLGQIELGSRSRGRENVIRFDRFESPHALMLARPTSEAWMLDIDSSKHAGLGLGRCQAEVEALAVKNEERQAGCARCE